MKNIKSISIGKNVNLTLIPESKFKTNLVSVFIQTKLERETVTKNALLPGVLKSGCNKYKTMTELTDIQEDLYGAYIGASASKRGESQVINFSLLSVNEEYLDEKIFEKTVELLNEVINNPLIEDGGFKKEYLELEKRILKDNIMGVINDKGRYALKKTNEIMFEGEPYAISRNGYIEDLDKIDAVSLYNHYKEILRTSPIEIVVEGGFDEKRAVDIIKENFSFERGEVIEIERCEFKKEIDKVKEVHEKMDIAQGKLVMGYRCNVDFLDEQKYYSLLLGSRILGGGADSKLFVNVREKESLCYTIYSTIEKNKSAMTVFAGIEAENYDRTVFLIKDQIEKLKAGDITDKEISNSKISFINTLDSMNDEIGRITDFYYSQSIGKTESNLEDIKEMINKATKEDIVEAIKDIELDTIYFLSK